MTLKEQMAADADIFTNPMEFGELVEYRRKDGVVPDVQIGFRQGATTVGGQLVYIEDEGSAIIPKYSIAELKAGDSFVRENGEEWHLDLSSVRGSDHVFWHVAVRKDRLTSWRG